ncbi:MAG: alpha-glucosidase C-terminal domain-containing protein [Ignavibacteriales bacterium]|nr:alpha-glucosidase C-terminal domain-containing protein [Ignavibacteriales bacterium]
MNRLPLAFLSLLTCMGCTMNTPTRIDLNGPWFFQVDSLDKGLSESWYAEHFNRSGWKEVSVPDYWERYNLPSYDGVGWFTTKFDYNAPLQPRALFFGGVDDDAEVWVNGKNVGSHAGYSEAFFLEITNVLRQGTNELTIRVVDLAGPGGIYKPVSVIALDSVHRMLESPFSKMPARHSEEWVKDAVIYEVYLRSFSKEGNFKALEKRVPELKQLGATVLWLMPIHPVGKVNRKGTLGSPYAVQDYYGINPEFGTLQDFRSLVKSVHDHGLKIIIDLVANHTSWDSKLIREHPEWFTKDSTGAIVPPNDDWTDVADLQYDNPGLREYMVAMMKYWVSDVGIDGYRCDVAELVPTEFWNRARRELDALKPVMMLSEGTFAEHHVEAFDLTYAWNFYDILAKVIGGSGSPSLFHELLKNESYRFPKGSLRLRFNTNHDKNAWDAPIVKKFNREGAKASAVLAFAFPGVPLIYNGEEAGNERRLDLFEKVEIEWKHGGEFRELYTALSRLRRNTLSLRSGGYQPLENSEGEKILSFVRQSGKERVFVVVNLSGDRRNAVVTLPGPAPYRAQEYFTKTRMEAVDGRLSLVLDPFAYRVFVSSGE